MRLFVFGKMESKQDDFSALIFGGAYAFQLRMQMLNMPIPNEILLMLPYFLTIALMMFWTKGITGLKALGERIIPGKKGRK